ncbi:MAG: bifunctional adenosylcobinamide kinase/adenosylcobinamide-phosphate guanylyltransferase [Planctomycetaceae bacterium]|jgi:adenosylcobinamide kinase/adenosylcobinamide-phosphate guanylyltransferase|nr:bifunctional adenosylcobinamide kinase/adenosylcobinamide-phosphate guanylyltransferase [Planctomycetaceae bacterium]
MVRVFISGGCKSGKSFHAQILAKKMQQKHVPLYYLATMIPKDDEDLQRIKKHQIERTNWEFETLEVSKNISSVLKKCNTNGVFLLDSITSLLANEMFTDDGMMIANAPKKLSYELTLLAEGLKNIVFVSDFIYSDTPFYDTSTEAFRKGLALIDRQLAGICETVLEISCGNVVVHKSVSESTENCNN